MRLAPRRWTPVRLLLALAVAATTWLAGSPASADSPATVDALLAQYAPVVVVRAHPTQCGDGEPYLPVPVDVVLGRPDVALRGPDGQVITTAPTAADLFGLGDGYYLDLPGAPLTPGCDYERWFATVGRDVEPAVYGRVVTDPDHPGTLVTQYWFWWVYNDWNDKHEGDWEMVQLLFDAATPEEALAEGPTATAYAQHEGSETAEWSDDKVLKDGTHPVVYPGQGSHAAYFTQARWFGKSAAAGFGCDDTTSLGTVVRPRVIALPTEQVTDRDDPFAWLTFTGRWGQKAPSFNNGPTGPVTKTQWAAPVTWVEDEGRPDAAPLPPLPGDAVDTFCGLTAAGSLLFVDLLANPALTVAVLLAVVLLLVVLVRRTRWRPARAWPLDDRRRAGQIVTSAVRVYVARPRLFGPLSVVLLATTVLVSLLQSLVLLPRPSGNLADVDGATDAWPQLAAGLVSVLIALPVTLVAVAAVAIGLRDACDGAAPSGWPTLGATLRRPGVPVTVALQWLVPVLLTATLLLLPLGLWLAARWAVAFPAAAFDDLRPGRALHRSAELTRGHRWRSLALTGLALLGATWTGPVVGALVLLLTRSPFWAANLVAAAVTAVLLPMLGAVVTLQYLDLRGRSAQGQDGGVDLPTEGAVR